MFGTDEARALHSRHPAIDLHADSLMWSRWTGYDLHVRHEAPLPFAALGGHVDIPRMIEGGVGAQFFGLVSVPFPTRGLAAVIDEQIDRLEQTVRVNPQRIRKARTAADIRKAAADGTIAALLGIEGGHALEGSIEKLGHFARRGVRYLGLCHFSANELCYPAYGSGRKDDRGLTDFGRKVVIACSELGVIVDLAHINKRGFLEACALAEHPPIVSHTGVLGAFEHWRNIDDEQLRAVADKGGVIGVIFCPRYLGADGIKPVVSHLKHIVNVCGEDAPALGSDWDGFIIPTKDLCDAARLPLLTDALIKEGFSEETIAKILRGNALRAIEDNPVPA
ncbi:MAG: dipeptidase [Polyangiaceae bacterium]|nr:dipeptidase [Polyangiaceae bacterium]